MSEDRIYARVYQHTFPFSGGEYHLEPKPKCAAYLLATPAREAADELLAALEQIANAMDDVTGGPRFVSIARAAIAKARQ